MQDVGTAATTAPQHHSGITLRLLARPERQQQWQPVALPQALLSAGQPPPPVSGESARAVGGLVRLVGLVPAEVAAVLRPRCRANVPALALCRTLQTVRGLASQRQHLRPFQRSHSVERGKWRSIPAFQTFGFPSGLPKV